MGDSGGSNPCSSVPRSAPGILLRGHTHFSGLVSVRFRGRSTSVAFLDASPDAAWDATASEVSAARYATGVTQIRL